MVKKAGNGGRFRKKVGYAVVSNAVVMDSNLSLRAKGLYLLIQTYITIPGFTLYKNFLFSKCKEGETAFDSAWNELKKNGYLKQYKMQEAETKQFFYEYELLDEPIDGNNGCVEPHPENHGLGKPYPDFPDLGFPPLGNPPPGFSTPGKSGCIINTIPSHSIPSHSIPNHILSGTKATIAHVKKQIAFDDLITTSEVDIDLLNEIVSLIAEVYDMIDNDTIRIQKRGIQAYYVKQKFKTLESKHIVYVADKIMHTSSDVKNPKAYVLTMLYNAPSTMETEMQLRVAHDMGKGQSWP